MGQLPGIDRKLAEEAVKNGLEAVRILHSIVLGEDFSSLNGNETVRRGVGLSIGEIEMKLLVPIFQRYPDLDDLKAK